MMNAAGVALNGRFSGTLEPTGTQRVAFSLFDALVRLPERDVPLRIFADPRFNGVAAWADAPGVTLERVPFSTWPRWKAQAWEQFALPTLCRRKRCRVAHHPITTSPTLQCGVRNIVTLHDLNFYKHPQWHSAAFRAVYNFTALPGLRLADRVVAISDYVREDAERLLRIKPGRLRRIYNGVSLDRAAEKTPRDVPYILCVGSLQPHKNLPRLIMAYRRLRERSEKLQLWVVGRPQPGFRAIEGLSELLATPGVVMLGYLSDAELSAAYANALAFCYPSLEEGFGLPMIEAMLCGTPVVASNASCLPEIAGGCAELVDPLVPDSIADGIQRVIDLSPEERSARIRAGRERGREFSWETSARQYLALYRELLDQPG